MGKDTLFTMLIIFWVALTIITNTSWIGADLSKSRIDDIYNGETGELEINSLSDLTDAIFEMTFGRLTDVPIAKNFVPLFRLMFFQYSGDIPYWFSVVLIGLQILTMYLTYTMIRGF